MFNPLIAIVKDALSHSFEEAYHISVIHAKYGANHLENELANSAADNNNGKNQNTVKSEQQAPVHVSVKENNIDLSFSIKCKCAHSSKPSALAAVFIAKQIQPPKSIA